MSIEIIDNSSPIEVIDAPIVIEVPEQVVIGSQTLASLLDVDTSSPTAFGGATLKILADENDTDNWTAIFWTPPGSGGGGGEANDGRNIGTGQDVFAGKNVPPLLDFYRFNDSTEIAFTNVTNSILGNIVVNSIANNKLATINTNTIRGRVSAATGNIENLSATQVRAIINVEDGAQVNQTDTEIKTQYENNADTNAFTDAEQSKLSAIEAGAQVNDVDSVNAQTGIVVLDTDDISDTATNRYTNDTDIARLANTSGTNTGDEVQATEIQLGVAEIAALVEVNAGTDDKTIITPLKLESSDLRAEIATNTLKVSNVTHTGEATGDTALTIDPSAITNKPEKVSVVGPDQVLIADSAAGDALKRVQLSNLGGGGGADELNDLNDVDTATAPQSVADGTLEVLAKQSPYTAPAYQVFRWSPPSAGGGETNDGINLGAGAQVYEGKAGATLRFRSLLDSTEILTTQNTNDITFAIASSSIGFDKINDISQNEILGRSTAGIGAIESLSATDVRAIINVEDGAQVNTVDSVNTLTGAVTLITDDINDTATNRYTNDTDISRLATTSGTNTGNETTATQTSEGIAEIATVAEIDAQVLDDKIISPMGLAGSQLQFDVSINNGKVSADGSVTTHNDVTNAGSGAIITVGERSNIVTNNAKISADGSVTTHNDVTDAGSGIIISATERSNILTNNAKVSADGSVTTHNDVTDAGSGIIISATERSNITDRTTHTGESTYNDEDIIFQDTGVEVGRTGALLTEPGVFLASTDSAVYDPNDGGIAAKPGRAELHGSAIYFESEAGNTDFRQALFSPDGQLYGVPLPEPSWEVSDTDAADYDLGTGTGAGAWVRVTTLTVQFPQAASIGETINVDYSLYTVNKTLNRTGNIEIGFTNDSGTPVAPTTVDDFNFIASGFAGYISGRIAIVLVAPIAQNDFVRIWARINNGSNSQYGLDLLGTIAPHSLLVSTPSQGGGSGEINDGVNVGTGAEVFETKIGVNLRFRTLVDTSEIVATQNVNDITFALATNSVAFNKISVIGQNEILGRIAAGSGDIESLTAANVRTIINVEDGAQVNEVSQAELDALKVETFSIGGLAFAPVNGTYIIEHVAKYAYTIEEIDIVCDAGSCTVAIAINGTNVTGLGSVSVTTTSNNNNAIALNTVSIGQEVTMVVSAVSGINNLTATLNTTRT